MKVIAYIGVIGSGKDYTANKECDIQMAFADKLREDVWTMIGWRPKTDEEYESFKIRQFEILNGSGIYFTGRELLQRYGTEVRRKEDPEHWAKMLESKILEEDMFGKAETIGITDCRFPNEVKAVKLLEDLGIDVEFRHVNFKSDRYTVDPKHESEKLAIECLQFWGDNDAFQDYINNI